MKDRCSGAALIFAIAARSVAVTSVFAGLSKPMWLSLICTNRSSPLPAACAIGIFPVWPSGMPLSTPLDIVQTAPVPTHAMHSKKLRRSICLSSSFFATHPPSPARDTPARHEHDASRHLPITLTDTTPAESIPALRLEDDPGGDAVLLWRRSVRADGAEVALYPHGPFRGQGHVDTATRLKGQVGLW